MHVYICTYTYSCKCNCIEKCTGFEYPRHCNDFSRIRKPPADNGFTIIRPDDGEAFPVYCNMRKFGGGWTRILTRYSRQMSFSLDWNAYKNGFGYLSSDGWLGLEKIHRLTKNKPATPYIIKILTGIIHNTGLFRSEVKLLSINSTLGILLEMVVTLYHSATMPSLALTIKIMTAALVIVLAHIMVDGGTITVLEENLLEMHIKTQLPTII